jgi:hypothetical protein
MLRLKYVLDFREPLHVLEVTRLVLKIKEKEILKHGPGVFYTWGGKRKNRKSFVKVLEEQFPHKSYYLRAVDLLGQHLGLLAIEGLYDYLTTMEKDLTIYQVNKMNPILRLVGLRKKIENRIGALAAEGEDIDGIREEVGRMAYDVLLSNPNDYKHLRRKRRKKKGGKGEEDTVPDENEESASKPFNFEPGPIGSKDFPSIKELVFTCKGEFSNLAACFQGKKQLTTTDSEGVCQCWKNLNDAVTNFWKAFMRASKN